MAQCYDYRTGVKLCNSENVIWWRGRALSEPCLQHKWFWKQETLISFHVLSAIDKIQKWLSGGIILSDTSAKNMLKKVFAGVKEVALMETPKHT